MVCMVLFSSCTVEFKCHTPTTSFLDTCIGVMADSAGLPSFRCVTVLYPWWVSPSCTQRSTHSSACCMGDTSQPSSSPTHRCDVSHSDAKPGLPGSCCRSGSLHPGADSLLIMLAEFVRRSIRCHITPGCCMSQHEFLTSFSACAFPCLLRLQFPDRIESLRPITQLYVSVDAATPESLKAVDRPLFSDYWERFLACLRALKAKRQRTVYR